MVSSSSFCFFSLLPPFLLFLLAPEKLIEGLKSPEPALLLPELLPLADPFGSTADTVNGNCPCAPCAPLHAAPGSQSSPWEGMDGAEAELPFPSGVGTWWLLCSGSGTAGPWERESSLLIEGKKWQKCLSLWSRV